MGHRGMTLDPGIDEQASCRQCAGTYTFYERDGLEVCTECGHQRRNVKPWYKQAACTGMDTDRFFPHRGDSQSITIAAKAICAGCPVQQQCLDYALDTTEIVGIWGGLTESERRALRHERGAVALTRFCVGCRLRFETRNRGKYFCNRACYITWKQHPVRRKTRTNPPGVVAYKHRAGPRFPTYEGGEID